MQSLFLFTFRNQSLAVMVPQKHLIVLILSCAGFFHSRAQSNKSSAELHELYRPQFHFSPKEHWMNDPNGPIFWKGRYHMFYQHNPGAAVWGDMHWGHASSPDMIHWRHLPIALAPTHGGMDKDGVFSGCTVDNNGVPTIVYTGTQPEVQCLATGRDDRCR